MTTDSCERCVSPSPEALLRNVELHVDGSEVDSQTICPDCFSDWIAHYQEQMAGNMPGTEGGAEDDKTPSDSALNAAVAAAQERSESHESPTMVGGASDRAETVEEVGSGNTGGDEIRKVGGGSTGSDGDVAVDLGGESDVPDDDGDDEGGLILG